MNFQAIKSVLQRGLVRPNLIVGVILILLIWFIAPMITISAGHPFASPGARILILGILALALLIKMLVMQIKSHGKNTWPILVEKTKMVYQKIKSGFVQTWFFIRHRSKHLKENIQQDRHRRLIRKKPWYLVLGTEHSGKKHFIANSGLYFAKPEHFGQEAVK